jgi:hypothetical protein
MQRAAGRLTSDRLRDRCGGNEGYFSCAEWTGGHRRLNWESISKQAMRNGQNKRMRGRNRKGQNPLTRIYESNGPDVKIRGTASHVADKYVQLARDAQTSGDPVAAENYLQHAEHYFRLIAAAQEQFRQTQPYFRSEGEAREDALEEIDDDQPLSETPFSGREPPFSGREPQSHPGREAQGFSPRDAQPYQSREPHPYAGREPQPHPRPQGPASRSEAAGSGEAERLPAFITGNGPQPPTFSGYPQPNGFDNQPDRFPLHRRRRRRHGGPRGELPASPGGTGPTEEPQPPPPSGPVVD